MSEPLWKFDAVIAAVSGQAEGPRDIPITSVSIDSRTLEKGALFVAIVGDNQNGHDYVEKAFKAGAAAALVSKDFQLAEFSDRLIHVDDTLEALCCLGVCARARTNAKIIAVTGSVGKTGTKESLRLALSQIGETHASQKSYNNQWGVPLSLALMPASTKFGIFEVGMNHPGEITPLTRLIRPHIAIITTVEPVHIGFFKSIEGIAEAKAEIFDGLRPDGVAILNGDNAHFALLKERAEAKGARIIKFGVCRDAEVSIVKSELGTKSSNVTVAVQGLGSLDKSEISYEIGAPGLHHVMNSLTVVGTLGALNLDIEPAINAMARFVPQAGRGTRMTIHLSAGPVNVIDESYNANPASVRAALAALAQTPRASFPRRIAVLGDMLELGDHGAELHRDLAGPIEEAEIDSVFACGPNMANLMEALPEEKRGGYAQNAESLKPLVLEAVKAGDAVMIKGSLGSKMSPLVEALCSLLNEKALETNKKMNA